MLIKSIELDNFRIFSGRQRIEFSTDAHKNVTVIMGDNGAGKTTLAQAFSWCLYGETTFKKSDDLLSFPVRDRLLIGGSATVSVSLALSQNGQEYHITRTQEYRKDSSTYFHADTPVLYVSRKGKGGNDDPIKDEAEKRDLINEIMPKSVSSYFFFDGERVERMGNEIQGGRSKEFKKAVENLLGLSAISEAMRHLGQTITSYNKDYNQNSDDEFLRTEQEIAALDDRIGLLVADIEDMQERKDALEVQREEYQAEYLKATETEAKNNELNSLKSANEEEDQRRTREMKALATRFGRGAWEFFVAPLLASALSAIDASTIQLKEAPSGVTADTIKDIVERKECLCGTHIEFDSVEYNRLREWLSIVPPEHIGAALGNYRKECQRYQPESTPALSDDVELHISNIRMCEKGIERNNKRIKELAEELENAPAPEDLKRRYITTKRHLEELEEELKEKTIALGQARELKRAAELKRAGLRTDDLTNKRVRRDREYAEFIRSVLDREHARKEAETRSDLESEINAIFQEFFNGSLQLDLDNKYNVTVRSREHSDFSYDVETSEGQTIAVIFAFIAGVIRLATDSKRKEDEMLLTEAYPLVMDAPMSKLDKKRIAAICEVVPRIAEQTVIMIKDTDGELARDYLMKRIGAEYEIASVVPERHSSIERIDRYV